MPISLYWFLVDTLKDSECEECPPPFHCFRKLCRFEATKLDDFDGRSCVW
jgi:hypothetical protein